MSTNEASEPAVAPELKVFHEGAITHAESSVRANRVNRVARMVVKPALRWTPLTDGVMRKIQELDRVVPPAEDIISVPSEFAGVPGEMFWRKGGVTNDVTFLYFHGGGFFAGSVNSYRRLLEFMARQTGSRVVSVDYRMLPDAHLGESVDDAISVYTNLVSSVESPEKIVIGGDSAGGYLTFKVAELARRRSLADPAALMGFSPLLSLDVDNQRKAVQRAVPISDAYLPIARVKTIRKRWLPEGAVIEGFADPFNASSYISSPTFLLAGENEMLRPETEAFASRLVGKDVPVEFHVWRNQVHAFTLLVDLVPEARVAVSDALAFVAPHVGIELGQTRRD